MAFVPQTAGAGVGHHWTVSVPDATPGVYQQLLQRDRKAVGPQHLGFYQMLLQTRSIDQTARRHDLLDTVLYLHVDHA